MKKILVIFGALILMGGGCLNVGDEYNIEYKICDIDYKNCHTIAKFKDIEDCETTNEKWSWYCNQTDLDNIKCHVEKSSIVTSYCAK